jgi:hypothetical protein
MPDQNGVKNHIVFGFQINLSLSNLEIEWITFKPPLCLCCAVA